MEDLPVPYIYEYGYPLGLSDSTVDDFEWSAMRGRAWYRGLAGMGLGMLGFAGPVAAQHPRAPIGVQIGYSQSKLGGSAGDRARTREGALAGVYLTGRLGPWLSIQPELLFAIKGGETTAELEEGTIPVGIELAYLEVPMLLKFTALTRHGPLHPVFFGGVAPSVQVGCDVTRMTDGVQQQLACKNVGGFDVKEIDVGGVIGGGMQWDWSETALALEARYTIGLSSIRGREADVRNRQLGIMLALSF